MNSEALGGFIISLFYIETLFAIFVGTNTREIFYQLRSVITLHQLLAAYFWVNRKAKGVRIRRRFVDTSSALSHRKSSICQITLSIKFHFLSREIFLVSGKGHSFFRIAFILNHVSLSAKNLRYLSIFDIYQKFWEFIQIFLSLSFSLSFKAYLKCIKIHDWSRFKRSEESNKIYETLLSFI